MNVLPALLLIALIVIQDYTAYAQLAGGRPGLRQQIVRQQQKRGRQEEQRRSDQAAQLQQRMVQRVSRTDPNNPNLPGTTVTAPADGPYLPSDDAAAAGQYFPSVFNGVIGPYSSRSSRAPGGPEFAFGWAPVVLDGSPEEEYDEAWQQPKVWNYRCYKACGRYQMNPMRLYGGNNQPADLCYFNRTRPDGKPYFVAGTWFPGERENRWESTCRGRDANGGPAVQFALGWDKKALVEKPGFWCGCCGCIRNCWMPGVWPGSAGYAGPCGDAVRFNLAVPAGVLALNPSSSTCRGSQGKFPVCFSDAPSSGIWRQWGTAQRDGRCVTFGSLGGEDARLMCAPQFGV